MAADGARGPARLSASAPGCSDFALAALFALHKSVPGAAAALLLAAGAVGWLAGPSHRDLGGVGRRSTPARWSSASASSGRARTYGLAAILWLFAVVWGADIAAYFAGRLIGGPRLWPSVSPGKTWSGAIVGALAGAAFGLLLAGLDQPDRPAVLARAGDGGRLRAWRSVRIRAEAALRRQGFERPHSRPRRR